MAMDTIQTVKQAELQASQSERAAHVKGDELISKAISDAKALVTSMTREALIEAQNNIEKAKRQSSVMIEQVVERTNKEVMLLKELSKKKEQEAIRMVCSHII